MRAEGRLDCHGYFWLLGGVDDVLNMARHRIGRTGVESALVSRPTLAEAAVIGMTHGVKAQAIAAFVTPRPGIQAGDALANELREYVAGGSGRPRVQITSCSRRSCQRLAAPITRRLLRDIAVRRVLGDTTTLTDRTVLTKIKRQHEESEPKSGAGQ